MLSIFSNPVLKRLIDTLSVIFAAATTPTRILLIQTFFSMCALNSCKSVRFMYRHFHSSFGKKSLNSLYAMFNEGKIDLSSWTHNFCNLLDKLIPDSHSAYPIYLIMDDTLIEKKGTHFDAWSKLFDHASHNGTDYLNGHCVVTLVAMLPLKDGNGRLTYVRVPLRHKLWIPKKNKEKEAALDRESIVPGIPYKTKYELLREMLEEAVSSLGRNRHYVLLGDSWYPKADVIAFINENENVGGVFNVPIKTAMYDCEVPGHTGRRGRPREYGDHVSAKDFLLMDIPGLRYLVGWRDVTTNLFGKRKRVRALVTESRETHSRRLFLCTDPDMCTVPKCCITDKTAKDMSKAFPELLCFACYTFRWSIEVIYQEQKAHWGLEDYMLRSVTGIERLINLQSMVYAVLCVLPWIQPAFRPLEKLSVQDRRYEVGLAINQDMFLSHFAAKLANRGNSRELELAFSSIRRSLWYFGKSGS